MNINPDKIGALWSKKTLSGKDYYSGEIEINGEKIKIVCFSRESKRSEREPDWDILISKPKEIKYTTLD